LLFEHERNFFFNISFLHLDEFIDTKKSLEERGAALNPPQKADFSPFYKFYTEQGIFRLSFFFGCRPLFLVYLFQFFFDFFDNFFLLINKVNLFMDYGKHKLIKLNGKLLSLLKEN
jgi:hypothetical protein